MRAEGAANALALVSAATPSAGRIMANKSEKTAD